MLDVLTFEFHSLSKPADRVLRMQIYKKYANEFDFFFFFVRNPSPDGSVSLMKQKVSFCGRDKATKGALGTT